jgi:hypothetical protein
MRTLSEKVVELERTLTQAEIPHAFGGALALAYHITRPRGTDDIDVNVFVDATECGAVFEALPESVTWGEADVELVRRDGQVRLRWENHPLDLFFSNHAFHQQAENHVVTVPFADIEMPILGADELALFKAFFDRTKDWADLEAMHEVGSFDGHLLLGWLVDMLGADDQRVEKMRALLRRPRDEPEPIFRPR